MDKHNKIMQLFCDCYFTDERNITSYLKKEIWILFVTCVVFIIGIFVPLQKWVYFILIWLYMINFAIFLFKQMKFHEETKKKLADIDNGKEE
jgi:Ca2+/Na+ antiporter